MSKKSTVKKVSTITEKKTQVIEVQKQVTLWSVSLGKQKVFVGIATGAYGNNNGKMFISDDEAVINGIGLGPFTPAQLAGLGQAFIELATDLKEQP